MHIRWIRELDPDKIRRAALALFCAAAAAGSVHGYVQSLPQDEVIVLYDAQSSWQDAVREGLVQSGEAFEERMDLNAATLEDLCALQGIGPSKAQAILDYRDSAGGFVCVEELMEVKGIGEATFGKIAPYLYVEESDTP